MLKAKIHSAKVLDQVGIKTLLRRADRQFPASPTCGWRRATEGRTKAPTTGCARTSGGAWTSSSVQKSPPRRGCSDGVGCGVGQREGVAVDWRKLLPPKG